MICWRHSLKDKRWQSTLHSIFIFFLLFIFSHFPSFLNVGVKMKEICREQIIWLLETHSVSVSPSIFLHIAYTNEAKAAATMMMVVKKKHTKNEKILRNWYYMAEVILIFFSLSHLLCSYILIFLFWIILNECMNWTSIFGNNSVNIHVKNNLIKENNYLTKKNSELNFNQPNQIVKCPSLYKTNLHLYKEKKIKHVSWRFVSNTGM